MKNYVYWSTDSNYPTIITSYSCFYRTNFFFSFLLLGLVKKKINVNLGNYTGSTFKMTFEYNLGLSKYKNSELYYINSGIQRLENFF